MSKFDDEQNIQRRALLMAIGGVDKNYVERKFPVEEVKPLGKVSVPPGFRPRFVDYLGLGVHDEVSVPVDAVSQKDLYDNMRSAMGRALGGTKFVTLAEQARLNKLREELAQKGLTITGRMIQRDVPFSHSPAATQAKSEKFDPVKHPIVVGVDWGVAAKEMEKHIASVFQIPEEFFGPPSSMSREGIESSAKMFKKAMETAYPPRPGLSMGAKAAQEFPCSICDAKPGENPGTASGRICSRREHVGNLPRTDPPLKKRIILVDGFDTNGLVEPMQFTIRNTSIPLVRALVSALDHPEIICFLKTETAGVLTDVLRTNLSPRAADGFVFQGGDRVILFEKRGQLFDVKLMDIAQAPWRYSGRSDVK